MKSQELVENDCTYVSLAGTTWVSYMLSLIHNNGRDITGRRNIFEIHPYLEFCKGQSAEDALTALENKDDPRIMVTHLPAHFLESKIKEVTPKVIVVLRNPKDTLVSLFHFYRMSKPMGKFQGSWDEFFEMFTQNRLWSGNLVHHNAS